MLLVVTLAIPNLAATAAAENPFLHVITTGIPGALGRALVWMVIGAMWFCGLSSITSNSRMLFAFARDGGLPGSRYLAKVSPRFRSPHVAVWVSAFFALLVALWSQAYSAMVALSTIALYASYALPIAIGLHARRHGRWTAPGPWHLGRASVAVNVVAIAWVAVVTVLFVLPPNQLAGYTFAGCLVLLAAYWFGYMRRRFSGPRGIG
jgi:amino acid transporter